MSAGDWDYHLSQCVVNSWLQAETMPTSTAERCPKTCETELKVDLPKPSDCIDLRTLYSRGIQPVGLVRLDSICELEAHFSRNHYDGFFVRDCGPLRRAIQDVSPFCASRMKSDLHMTVRYPGVGQVPSMSKEDAEAFGQGSSFPPVRIFIRDIYLSKDRNLAAAVVYGIDTPVAAMGNAGDINGKTPPHLTLWAFGRAPVAAGQQLVGLKLETRAPFVQVTERCLRDYVRNQRKTIQEKTSRISELTKEGGALKRHVTTLEAHVAVLEGLMKRKTVTAQAAVRGWLARIRSSRMRKMHTWTQVQHALLCQAVERWRESRRRECRCRCGWCDQCEDYEAFCNGGYYWD
jgi:hypothetical protein